MSAAVVDASVVLRWLLIDEADRTPALAVRDRIVAGQLVPHQPPHFTLEIASALVRAARAGRIQVPTVAPLVRSLESFRLGATEYEDFASAAADAALELGLRVPDAGYVVCARRAGATLITADRRLHDAASAAGISAALLGSLT